jgi:hypothetical protein
MRCILLLLVVSAAVMAGCASMSEERAQATALDFVKSRVRFYSQDQSYVASPAEYDFRFATSSLQGENWVFFINVSASRLNETKSAFVRIVVDSKTGQVLDFGQIK